jgi:hypothetical protein
VGAVRERSAADLQRLLPPAMERAGGLKQPTVIDNRSHAGPLWLAKRRLGAADGGS